MQAYDPELFSKALPCLSAIGCALSPDYSLTSHPEDMRRYQAEANEIYTPDPVETGRWVLLRDTVVFKMPVLMFRAAYRSLFFVLAE